MNTEQPILIAGLGSIGRRHLQNLLALGYDNLLLYRTGKSTLPENPFEHIPTEYDLAAALAKKPLATIIANPTALHLPVAIEAAKAGSHLLLEKPISHSLDGIAELQRIVTQNHLKVMMGFQYRFHPTLQQVKTWLDQAKIGQIVTAEAHYGEYLPGWHPWEDYRKSYSAQAALGGGVLLTLCHPFDMLRWLVGEITAVSAVTGIIGGLEVDSEDTALTLLQFDSGAFGSVHLNYVERPTARWVHLVGQCGTIHWDDISGKAILYEAETEETTVFNPPAHYERNVMFLHEMGEFLNLIFDEPVKSLSTFADGIRIQHIIEAIKLAAAERTWQDV